MDDFFVKENALKQGITIEEEWEYQKSTFDGLGCEVSYQQIVYMMELENEFKIHIPDEKAEQFKTMQDVFDHVEIEFAKINAGS